MRLFKYLIFVLVVFASSQAFGGGRLNYLKGAVSQCLQGYSKTTGNDTSFSVGISNIHDFSGFLYTPTANECICKIDVYVASETGDPTGNTYYLRIFTVDGNADAATVVATSTGIAGAAINGMGGNWMSDISDYFNFSPCASLTAATTYAITAFIDKDSNLDDDPEYDASNYWNWGYDNENNGDAVQGGLRFFGWDDTIPYADSFTDAEDDVLIKIFTQ